VVSGGSNRYEPGFRGATVTLTYHESLSHSKAGGVGEVSKRKNFPETGVERGSDCTRGQVLFAEVKDIGQGQVG